MSAINERLHEIPSASGAWRRGFVKVVASRVWTHLRTIGASMTRRRQIFALAQLDDRMLSDIGLTRSDLDAASRWSLWGDTGERLAAIAEERREARRSGLA